MKGKPRPRSPVLTRVAKHLYAGDGVADVHGQDRCGDCGLGRGHPVHELPSTDPDVVAGERRRVGGDR